MKKTLFTKRKLITFYSKVEKHKILEKKIFYQILFVLCLAPVLLPTDIN